MFSEVSMASCCITVDQSEGTGEVEICSRRDGF